MCTVVLTTRLPSYDTCYHVKIMNLIRPNNMRYLTNTIISLSVLVFGFSLALPAFASAQSLPPGVTLQQIDGGPNYYCNNGFTYACNAGWDNPSFFSIGPWLAPIRSQADIDRWKDLGLNTAFGATGDSNVALMRQQGIWLVPQLDSGLLNQGLGSETVGLNATDEADPAPAVQTTANSLQDHRFWWQNQTWNYIVYGDSGAQMTTLFTTPNGTQRHLDEHSIDFYWSSTPNTSTFNLHAGGLLTNLGRDMTIDELKRGSNYGPIIDTLRSYQAGHYPAPIGSYVENGGPGTDFTAASYITPPQLNWAVWSSIIHGARFIMYFNHTFGGPAQSQDNLANSYYQTTQSGQTTSIYAQTKATDALVKQLAPVINSPTALGYVTVNPAPTTLSGIETMAKYYNNQFYIFADTRMSETATNISATFTIKNTGATSVTVVNESRTIPITNGGTTFTDTFAKGSTVHIYQVGAGGPADTTPPSTPTGLTASAVSSSQDKSLVDRLYR